MKTRLILILWSFTMVMYAQTERPWEKSFHELMTLEEGESASWQSMYEQLCELEDRPIHLNTATREELQQLPFLSEQQIEEIQEYLYRYGPMKTPGELQMIRSLDFQSRQLLTYFIVIDDKGQEAPPIREAWRHGRQELMAFARIPFYQRKGDKDGYLGYPYMHWLRYDLSCGDRIRAGLIGAQDAGEPFLANRNRYGYDYYSYYLTIRRMGVADILAAGKYRLAFGMGLTVNASFGFGKIAALQNLGRSQTALRPHSSRSEGIHFQGLAATLRLSKSWTVTPFISYRPLDGTLNKDSTTISSLVTTGYHRTPSEMRKKHNTHAFDTGFSLQYLRHGILLGASSIYTRLDRRLAPNTKVLYRKYNPAGSDFLNASVHYGYTRQGLSVRGETAVNRQGAVATLNSLSYMLSSEWSVMALQRFYSYRYTSLYAQSFSEGGHVQNESGVYLGVTWRPSLRLQMMAYTDYAYFAWPRYQTEGRTHVLDRFLSVKYQRKFLTVDGRYRWHRDSHRGRLAVSYAPSEAWSSRTQADIVYAGGRGYMLSERWGHKWKRLRTNATFGYFHTDGYDSRIYLYEPSTLYDFSFPVFYGKGIRYTLTTKIEMSRQWSVMAKWGVTDYFNRSVISSGYQQVNHSSMSDMDIQIRWKF